MRIPTSRRPITPRQVRNWPVGLLLALLGGPFIAISAAVKGEWLPTVLGIAWTLAAWSTVVWFLRLPPTKTDSN